MIRLRDFQMMNDDRSRLYGCKRRLPSMIIILLLVQSLITIIILASFYSALKSYIDEIGCIDDECLNAAIDIKSKINFSVNPCDDFYEFSCGNYKLNEKNPFLKTYSSTLNELENANNYLISNYLYNLINHVGKVTTNCTMNDHMVEYFKLCIETNDFNNKIDNNQNLKSLMNSSSTLYQCLVVDKECHQSLESYLAETLFQSYYSITSDPKYPFFVISINPHIKQENNFAFIIKPSFNFIPAKTNNLRENYLNILNHYYGIELDESIDEILDFSDKLNQIVKNSEIETRYILKIMDIESISKIIQINLTELINSIYQTYIPGLDITDYMSFIQIQNIDYFIKLGELLKTIPLKTKLFYVLLNQAYYISSFTNRVDQEKIQNFRRLDSLVNLNPNSWNYCLNLIEIFFSHSISSLYFNQTMNYSKVVKVSILVDNIYKMLKFNIQNADWMDESSKTILLNKIGSIYVNYLPDNGQFDCLSIENFYINMDWNEIKGKKFIEYSLILSRNMQYNLYKIINNKYERNRLGLQLSSLLVNAAYFANYNSIEITASIINQPILNTNPSLDFIIYSRLGLLVAHEFLHALDTIGIHFNENGLLLEEQTISNQTMKKYLSNVQCFIDQYNSMSLEEHMIDGKRTIDENIADNGGINVAFKAFHDSERFLDKQLLPGLNFNSKQLFYIYFAQLWCNNYDKAIIPEILSGVHSPNKIRVNAPLMNSKDFSETFICKPKQNMNPINKCRIW